MLPNTAINRAKLEIVALDHSVCRNPECEDPRFMLAVHRIIRGGVPYTPNVSISLCAVCHNNAEGKGNPKDKDGNRTTGDKFLLTILEFWENKTDDRWEAMRTYLRGKIEKKEIFK